MFTKESHTPIRPPRGNKISKDTACLLLYIITEIDACLEEDVKKLKKQQYEKDFKVKEEKLSKLITEKRATLSDVNETFTKISSDIDISRKRCQEIKEKLTSATNLLQCERDELRQLWLESVEYGEVYHLLIEIEELLKVREKIEQHLKEENFLEATKLLVSSIDLLDGKLSGVDALKDLKTEIQLLRETLLNVLIQALNKHLYMTPAHVFLKVDENINKNYEELFCTKQFTIKLPTYDSIHTNQESRNSQLAIILECIFLLNALPETIDILKEKCNQELMSIIRNTSELMYNVVQNSTFSYPETRHLFLSPNIQEQHFLVDLLEAILNQFRYVAINHQIFLDNLKKIIVEKNMQELGASFTYEMVDIYSKLQATIEIFIGDYLDLHNTDARQQHAAASFAKVTPVTDISSYFLQKTPIRPKNFVLFKFDCSAAASNTKAYLKGQKESLVKDSSDTGEQTLLICQQTTKNIPVIFKPLKNFVYEIESALQKDYKSHCPLHIFLMDSSKVFLDQVALEINKLMDKATASLEVWNPILNSAEELKGSKTILKSTLTLNNGLKEFTTLIHAMPDYSSHFLQQICHMLQTYKNICTSAYNNLICPSGKDQHIFSVSWARDGDISRLLRSLPNWINLKKADDVAELPQDYEESPEEIRFRNKEESEILIRNLTCKDSISLNEILSDSKQLYNLALMHESMEWFSFQILNFIDNLSEDQANVLSGSEKLSSDTESNSSVPVEMNIKECLMKLVKDFQDLADTCLLVLHLEVRAHCFYYLLPFSKEGSYYIRKDNQECEPEVEKLNSDLVKIDEALSSVLLIKKSTYIFEGLGELLSTIFINSLTNIKKINEIGVKKMIRNIFAVQQTLSSITSTREVALDRARQYYELLNLSFEDILNKIVELGPQFQKHEYSAAIQLLHNSRQGTCEQEPLSTYLTKLHQILDEVAVSV